jgi:hypothetical protein
LEKYFLKKKLFEKKNYPAAQVSIKCSDSNGLQAAAYIIKKNCL